MERWDVVVIGGGLSAGAAATRAAGQRATVLVVPGRTAGGRAATDERSGFRLNRGAHALYDRGPGRAVLERLGVPVPGAAPSLAQALGRRGDLVDRLPMGAASAIRTRLCSLRDLAHLAKVLAGQRWWHPEDLADRTIDQWIDDDLGLTGGARELFAMLIRLSGYVADHGVISADVAATQLRIGSGGVTYVDGGWTTLVGGLFAAAEQSGAVLRPGVAAAVEPLAGGGAVVRMAGPAPGEVTANAVVLATGSPAAAASLLPEPPPAWADPGPVVAASCLDLGLAEVPPTPVLLGVDRPLYLIRHAPPAQLAPPGHAVVHVMQYRTADDPSGPAETRARLEEHVRVAGIDPGRAVVARYLHHMPVVTAAATPAGGGLAGRPGVTSSGLPGILVAGDWVGPTGHLADAVLVSGDAAGAAAAAAASRAPLVRPAA